MTLLRLTVDIHTSHVMLPEQMAHFGRQDSQVPPLIPPLLKYPGLQLHVGGRDLKSEQMIQSLEFVEQVSHLGSQSSSHIPFL